ncbi:MAG: DUF1592 domain-containing protein [Gemmataceae bacterium]
MTTEFRNGWSIVLCGVCFFLLGCAPGTVEQTHEIIAQQTTQEPSEPLDETVEELDEEDEEEEEDEEDEEQEEEEEDEPTPAKELQHLARELKAVRRELKEVQRDKNEVAIRKLKLEVDGLAQRVALQTRLVKGINRLKKAEEAGDEKRLEQLEADVGKIHLAIEKHQWQQRLRTLNLRNQLLSELLKKRNVQRSKESIRQVQSLLKDIPQMTKLIQQITKSLGTEENQIEDLEETLEPLAETFEGKHDLFYLGLELAQAQKEGNQEAVTNLRREIRERKAQLREFPDPKPKAETIDTQTVHPPGEDLSKVMTKLDLEKQIKPMLRQYCYKCHRNNRQSGGLNLERIVEERPLVRNMETWNKVLEQLNLRTMPPQTSRQPTNDERKKLTGGIRYLLENVDWAKIRDPGIVPARRLTNTEYNNTVRDLLGIKSRPASKFPADLKGRSGFDNSANTLSVQTLLMEKYIHAAEECVTEAFPKNSTEPKSSKTNARKKIERLLLRAFRRPPTKRQIDQAMTQFDRGGMKRVVFTTLLSPFFLLRIEQHQDTQKVYRVDSWDMASRLSYYLWSSVPDDELFELARTRQLQDPKVLNKQIARMLADPKADSLGTVFASQWLGFDNLGTRVRLDPIDNPWCTDSLMDAMRAESAMFFVSLIRENRTLKDLVTADFTFLNEELAKHYRIQGVRGKKMRRVKLKDSNRGGIFGQGSLLAVTSFPNRTSPVVRGKWILTDVLGTPPPEPPPNASELAEEIEDRRRLTFREKMALHRRKPQCAACHQKIDPLGLSLENYDKFGRWRTRLRGRQIDASGQLPNGTKFSGPSGLKKVITSQRIDDLARQITRKSLAFALGRQLEYYDEPAVRKIVAALKRDNYQMQTLVRGVIHSYPFQYKKNPSPIGAKQ